ncbi:MAG: sulfur carrier protein ThiS [Paraprevotella sp.]|nr:sulfur carrier protein ThiS [Paraprevotella sp.]
MKVTVNNKEVETTSATISSLIEELSLPVQGVAVAVNNRLVPRTQWNDYALTEGMSLVVIKAACGG